ncbi:TetR family transcriptional regulator [Stackebrandtia endophytica]|uniref:TetR family transcriptional regulator n=1 Tax=Stackebrandtia endophytica TaxID=1496996 RepID=A0A543ARA4_9ACTN|nr:TetR/AcrR family transcriptional regulator [Stackebrandtia endophytica]TQL75111.1 TetR family transcriptional regulator [Stackebrandtia endophytica]
MPRKVDHEWRRAEITDAVVRLAGRSGLSGVTFREVAAEAGISVALVQRYFETKRNLILRTAEAVSIGMTDRFVGRLAKLGPDGPILDRLRELALSFLPTDEESRRALIFYHQVGAVGLTDPTMRGVEAHGRADRLVDLVADMLRQGQELAEVDDTVDAIVEARILLALMVGLSLSVLLENQDLDQVTTAIDSQLARLRRIPLPGKTNRMIQREVSSRSTRSIESGMSVWDRSSRHRPR